MQMNISNQYFVNYSNQLPTYEEFFNNVMKKNLVCLFNSNLTENWICRKEWIIDDQINFSFLSKNYGHLSAPVYNCNKSYFNSNPCIDMEFNKFIDYWKMIIEKKHQYDESNSILYLKDWHLAQDSNDFHFYNVPIYFESDYLNEFCMDKKITDYKFTYMGPKYSSTPLHIDVFGSFSWSANVIGTKKWLIIPSCNVTKFKSMFNELPHDLYSVPNYDQIINQVEGFEIIQKAGEVIFIPSGYMHQVINMDDTISINQNWFNGCNIDTIYANLIQAYNEVQEEINDLKDIDEDWFGTCQKLLTIHFDLKQM